MVLGKPPGPGVLKGQGPTAYWVVLIFFVSSIILFSFSLSLGLLVGCFGFNGPLRQYFSLYRAVSQREGERGEKG